MALQRATKPGTVLDSEYDDEDLPQEIERTKNGRPYIRALNEDGTESLTRTVTMTRASTLGKAIEDTYRLHRSDLRKVVFGLSRREDLVMRALAVAGQDERADKDELQAVAAAADEYAKGNAASTRGTAMHKLSERLEAGDDLSYLPEKLLNALAVYRKIMGRFTHHLTETFIVNDELGAAGSFDRLSSPLGTMVAPDGEVLGPDDRVIVDLKTSATADYFGPTYCVQQAIYQGGRPYTKAGGRGAWPDGVAPNRMWALLIHLPIESLADAGLWWVDLDAGRRLAQLCVQVRAERNAKGLFLPAELPSPETPAAVTKLGIIAMLRDAASDDELTRIWQSHASAWDGDLSRLASARAEEFRAMASASPAG